MGKESEYSSKEDGQLANKLLKGVQHDRALGEMLIRSTMHRTSRSLACVQFKKFGLGI